MDSGFDPDSDSDFTGSFVRILDRSNFFNTIYHNDFVVVQFTSSRCRMCPQPYKLNPRFEKAASILHNQNSTIVFAKIDALEDEYIANKYDINTFSPIKIFTNAGNNVQDYKGPLDSQGMVNCLKRLSSSFPAHITSPQNTIQLVGDNKNKTVVFGVFHEFSGVEHDNFLKAAQILKWDYDFGHTLNANHLAHGNYSSLLVSAPVVQVFKPFKYDDGFVDTRDFDVDHLVKFVQESSTPLLTFYNYDPLLDAAFFCSKVEYDKAMLFIDCQLHLDYEKMFCAVAKDNKGKHREGRNGISFMVVDSAASKDTFWLFELHKSEVPLFVIRKPSGETFVKTDMKNPDDISTWLEDYKINKVAEYGTITGEKDGLVRLIDADTFEEKFMDSDKNVFLLLGPFCHWCVSCKELAEVLRNVALRLGKENVDDVFIAKLYKNAHDIRVKYLCEYKLGVEDYPILCFKKAGRKKLYLYHGLVTENNIIQFIKKNRGGRKPAQIMSPTKLGLSESGPSSRGVMYIEDFQQMFMLCPFNFLLILRSELDMNQLMELLCCVADELRNKNWKDTDLLIGYKSADITYENAVYPQALVEVMHQFTTLDLQDDPTIVLKTASGKLVVYDYDGVISKENIINFIDTHKEDQYIDIDRRSHTYPKINYNIKFSYQRHIIYRTS
ncbi:hypothetical protein ACFE04_030732 [Oxalis oulophora]